MLFSGIRGIFGQSLVGSIHCAFGNLSLNPAFLILFLSLSVFPFRIKGKNTKNEGYLVLELTCLVGSVPSYSTFHC